jgi:pimeloyl-ACP methyl ester carboxylesterase
MKRFTPASMGGFAAAGIMLLALAAAACGVPEKPGLAPGSPQHSVRSPDGIDIVYESHGSGDAAVVFVHCWACNRGFWRYQVEAVLAAGHRVVSLDLPGHGGSGSDRSRWSVADLADDVLAVADALNVKRMVLVGHSMGGPVALAVAARAPRRVQGIICVDTLHNVEFEWPEGFAEELAGRLLADYRAGIEYFVPRLFVAESDPAIVQWVVDQAIASSHAGTIALMRGFPALDLPAMLAAASVPVRCINAAPAGGGGMQTATEINRKYADFNVLLMDDIGHYPQLERPQEFNAKLLALLAELASGN